MAGKIFRIVTWFITFNLALIARGGIICLIRTRRKPSPFVTHSNLGHKLTSVSPQSPHSPLT